MSKSNQVEHIKANLMANIFHYSRVDFRTFGGVVISGVEYKTDYGYLTGFFFKTKSIVIERNLCGFCLN